MQTNLFQLFVNTSILVARGRELALSGQKDQARDYLRFVQNGRVLEIFAGFDHRRYRCDVNQLRAQVLKLQAECHPEHPGQAYFPKTTLAELAAP